MKKILVSAVIFIDKNKKILMEKRYSSHFGQFYWQFPGGKVENKESLRTAAIREIKEELNIVIEKKDLTPFLFEDYFKTSTQFLIFYFICKNWKGSIYPHEKQQLEWVRISEINIKDILPYNGYVFNELINFLAK